MYKKGASDVMQKVKKMKQEKLQEMKVITKRVIIEDVKRHVAFTLTL